MPPYQPSSIRVAAVQYHQTPLSHYHDFDTTLSRYASIAQEEAVDILLFPELFTLQLLTLENPALRHQNDAERGIERLTEWKNTLCQNTQRLADTHNLTIIMGSHPARDPDNVVYNKALVFTPQGVMQEQAKLHITPNEQDAWGIQGGDMLQTIQTPIGDVGILICYDSEFPELARQLMERDIRVIFVPFCTDTAAGYYRVRHCCQARAIENQCYVVAAGNVGELDSVFNFDTHYAQSGIFGPCDSLLPANGVLAQAPLNEEALIITDLDMGVLQTIRDHGDVRNLADRRPDLY
jgi:predicted amidohydrolase